MTRIFPLLLAAAIPASLGSVTSRNADVQSGLYAFEGLVWDGCVVPYTIEYNEYSNTLVPKIKEAIRIWSEAVPGLTFRQTRYSDKSSLKFIPYYGDGGATPVGRSSNGVNDVELGHECPLGCVLHEIGHSLGLSHEQARSDRDLFVGVDMNNIQPGNEYNLKKSNSTDGQDVLPYDYSSIMHYKALAYSKYPTAGVRTILAPVEIGQRHRPSKGDIDSLRFIYNNCMAPSEPKCVASMENNMKVPYGKLYQVTFTSISGTPVTPAGMQVSYTDNGQYFKGLPEGAMLTTSSRGGFGHYHSGAVIRFIPPHTSSERRIRFSVQFTGLDNRVGSCAVDLVVMPSTAVCYGKTKEDPNVCSGHGYCTGTPHQPCTCRDGRGGPDCSGYAMCTKNYEIDFENEDSFFFHIIDRWDTKIVKNRGAQGSWGSLEVPRMTDFTPLETKIRPTKVSFDFATDDREGPLVTAYAGSGTCFDVRYNHQAKEFQDKKYNTLVSNVEKMKFYSFELIMDWAQKTVKIFSSGNEVGSHSLDCDGIEQFKLMGAPDGTKKLPYYQKPAYFDNLRVLCYGDDVPTPEYNPAPAVQHFTYPREQIVETLDQQCMGKYIMDIGKLEGDVKYPQSDSDYGSNLDVCWRMQCTEGSMQVTMDVDLGSGDFVSVGGIGVQVEKDGLHTMRGKMSKRLPHIKHGVTVRLVTDSYGSGKGIKFSYSCYPDEAITEFGNRMPSQPITGPVTPVKPVTPPVIGGNCQDKKLDGGKWYANMGASAYYYDCKFFGKAGHCDAYGDNPYYKNKWLAREACCDCGGGDRH